MKKIFVVATMIVSALALNGQEKFVFQDELYQANQMQIDYSFAGSHFLGDEIANKTFLLKKIYTHIEKGTPMSPVDKVIVKKPVIYYSVRKLDRYFKKELRKGRIEEAEARKKFNEVLDICISIYDQDTDEFEEYLRKRRKPEQILEAYEKVILE